MGARPSESLRKSVARAYTLIVDLALVEPGCAALEPALLSLQRSFVRKRAALREMDLARVYLEKEVLEPWQVQRGVVLAGRYPHHPGLRRLLHLGWHANYGPKYAIDWLAQQLTICPQNERLMDRLIELSQHSDRRRGRLAVDAMVQVLQSHPSQVGLVAALAQARAGRRKGAVLAKRTTASAIH